MLPELVSDGWLVEKGFSPRGTAMIIEVEQLRRQGGQATVRLSDGPKNGYYQLFDVDEAELRIGLEGEVQLMVVLTDCWKYDGHFYGFHLSGRVCAPRSNVEVSVPFKSLRPCRSVANPEIIVSSNQSFRAA